MRKRKSSFCSNEFPSLSIFSFPIPVFVFIPFRLKPLQKKPPVSSFTLSLSFSHWHTHTHSLSLTLTHVPAPSHSCTHTTGMYPFFDGLKGATAIELFANFIWQVSKVVSLRNGSWYQTSNFGPEMLLFRKRASAIGGSGLALSSNVIVTALKFKNGD